MAYSAKQLTKAIEGSGGFVTTIAQRLGCTPQTVYNLLKRYPSTKSALDDERVKMLDMAEGALMKQIKDGNTTAIIFFLKTQGKHRGYVERQEVTGADGGAIEVEATFRRALNKAYGSD